MDASKLGVKTAVLVDEAIGVAIDAAKATRCAMSTFCKAFSTELAARRAARQVPRARELNGTGTPF